MVGFDGKQILSGLSWCRCTCINTTRRLKIWRLKKRGGWSAKENNWVYLEALSFLREQCRDREFFQKQTTNVITESHALCADTKEENCSPSMSPALNKYVVVGLEHVC